MIDASVFIEHLRRLNFSQYVGVPCSYLKPFINFVIDDPNLDYIGAASEGEAVGRGGGAACNRGEEGPVADHPRQQAHGFERTVVPCWQFPSLT